MAAGSYLIINHSTGERFENIVVGASTSVTSPAETPPFGVDSVDFNSPYQATVQDLINPASESKTTILFLNSGSADVASDQIADARGGMVSNLGAASEEVVSTLKLAVATTISSVEVSMKPVGDGPEFVSSIEPEKVDLNLLEDRVIEFQVNLFPALPRSDEDRVFTFELITEAQGAEISRLTVELTVPADS